MKTNELRIGNLVEGDHSRAFCSDWGVMRITSIGETKVNGWNEYNRLRPIPLTEELLLKCGFEPTPHFTVVNSHAIGLGRGRVLSIGDTESPNQMAWLQSVDGREVTDLICVHNFDYDGKMHLHQLQNLFYAITGEELEIKL